MCNQQGDEATEELENAAEEDGRSAGDTSTAPEAEGISANASPGSDEKETTMPVLGKTDAKAESMFLEAEVWCLLHLLS